MLDFSITEIMKLTFAYLQFSGIARGGGGRGCSAVVLAPPLFLRTSQKLFVQSNLSKLTLCIVGNKEVTLQDQEAWSTDGSAICMQLEVTLQ